MMTPLLFLLLAALTGYLADRKFDSEPEHVVPLAAASIVCTIIGIMLLIL